MIERTARRPRHRRALLALGLTAALVGAGPAEALDVQIASPPGAQALGPAAYVLPAYPVLRGSTATYTNTDVALHDVQALDKGADGQPLFQSKLVGAGGQSPVEGVELLGAGSYAFTCSLHNSMKGILEVVDSPLPPDEPAPDPGDFRRTDWPLFGRDLANSRHGGAGPGAAELATYEEVWHHTGSGEGGFVGSPVVAAGKVFMGSSSGAVVSLDRDTGEPVWQLDLGAGGGDASVTASLAYHEGVVYAPAVVPDSAGTAGTAHVIALRAHDGAELWRTAVDDEQPLGDLTGSPVVWEDTDAAGARRARLFLGTSSSKSEGSGASELHLGTVVALDLLDGGALLWRTYMVEGGPHTKTDVAVDAATGKLYDGAGVASAPTVDTTTGTVYVGTGHGYESRHSLTGSIVSLAADDGQIVGHYQATASDSRGAAPPLTAVGADFAASPQLIEGSNGGRWVGAGQESSHLWEEQTGDSSAALVAGLTRYHVVDRQTMDPVWVSAVGPGHSLGGITGATAYDGSRIYGTTVWGQLFALDKDDGSIAWMTSSGDSAMHVAHTQVANGVVYAVDGRGLVRAWDAASGEAAWSSPVATLQEWVTPAGPSEGGVSVVGDSLISSLGSGGGAGSIRAYRSP